MNWNFWKKKKTDLKVKPAKAQAKPKDLPQDVGKYMVVQLGYDPDWVWALKSVVIEKENKKDCFDFRAFDAVTAHDKGVKVQNYSSLEGHPDLILFDGWYDKNSRQVAVNDHYKELKNGTAA
ncbi:MAG: hypothetical protein H8D87_05905 [Deltaproteobacteria bacterium]|nr:hypothetical protein [Candidatus Desulfobacula maris]